MLLVCLLSIGSGRVAMAAEGDAVCTIDDSQLAEVSGLAVIDGGYAVINDGGEAVSVFLLDDACNVDEVQKWPNLNPRDPEDLAVTSDGTFWIADIGDNDEERPTAAVWRIAPDADPVLYRLKYPDGAHDAEAILVGDDATPVIVTKDPSGSSQVFVSARPLTGTAATYNLTEVGQVSFTSTGTPGAEATGLPGDIAQVLVTGGAVAPDGSKVVLRTYTDAYEWDVPEGTTMAEAVTTTAPRHTPLPDEPQGEAIAYASDGSSFLTVSEGEGQPLRRWTPAGPSSSDSQAADAGDGKPWYSEISLQQVKNAIYIVGAFGLLLLGLGIFGVVRHRKRMAQENATQESHRGGGEAKPPPGPLPSNVYGASSHAPAPPASSTSVRAGGVYGQSKETARARGTVYGRDPL